MFCEKFKTKHIPKIYKKTPCIAHFKRKRNINYNNYRLPIHKIGSMFIYFFLWFQLEMIKLKQGGKGYIYTL